MSVTPLNVPPPRLIARGHRALRLAPTLAAAALCGCAMTTGIVASGPGIFTVSEMRAPVLGGAAEAQRVALGEANSFCARQGRVFTPLGMAPGGYPYSAYGPTNFTVSFQCAAPAR